MINPSENLAIRFSSAYQWLSKCRNNHPPDSDIWDLKKEWKIQADRIIMRFATGSYIFNLQKKITL